MVVRERIDGAKLRLGSPRFSLKSLLTYVAMLAIACWLYSTFHPLGIVYAWLLISALVGCVGVQKQSSWTLAVCTLMLLIGLFAFPTVTMLAHPVPIHRLSRIHHGSTADEVRALLGIPSSIGTSTTGETWGYSDVTWCMVRIRFDRDGKVVNVDHDH